MHCRSRIALVVICFVLGGCGVAEQPDSAASGTRSTDPMTIAPVAPLRNSTSVSDQQSLAPEATPETARATPHDWAFRTTQAKLRAEMRETIQAAQTSSPTRDLRPTTVPSSYDKLRGGGFLLPRVSYPSSHPRYTNAWFLDLPDGRQIRIYAGGYIFSLDKPYQEVWKPELGVFSVQVFWLRPDSVDKIDKTDPRSGRVTLPVRDGMARIVDALATEDRIMVMLRTDSSAYTYEVNSGTLAPAQPPTADAGGPYTLRVGDLLDISAQGRDPAGALFDYAWDLDGDGTFEAKGQRVTFSAKGLSGPQQHTVRVMVTARSGLSATAETTVAITQ